MIIVNRDKAEQIVRERLRIEREPELAALDIAHLKTLEEGGDPSEVVENKKFLRAITEIELRDFSLVELESLTLERLVVLRPQV
ncbi:hypothetical protein [Pseudomonas farsensis]|uniref:Uncharacterized protein n=1 Tax=Pseudomonas farsensis TaxID=2745492 RepID=A0ABU8QW97_9PSED